MDYQRVIKRYDELREQKRKEESDKAIKEVNYLGQQYYYDKISEETGYEPCSIKKIINKNKDQALSGFIISPSPSFTMLIVKKALFTTHTITCITLSFTITLL